MFDFTVGTYTTSFESLTCVMWHHDAAGQMETSGAASQPEEENSTKYINTKRKGVARSDGILRMDKSQG